jgi:hypothetical protein
MAASGRTKTHDLSPGRARMMAFFENIRDGLGALLRRPRLPPPCPSLPGARASPPPLRAGAVV